MPLVTAEKADSDRHGKIQQPLLSLDQLPAEIVATICRNLCMHCRLANVVDIPSRLVTEALQDQQALSRLCRTSRLFRDIAQPILFHFHTGIQHSADGDDEVMWKQQQQQENHHHHHHHHQHCESNTLESFLRSLLQRPDLAKHVRALAFFAIRAKTTTTTTTTTTPPHVLPQSTQLLFRQAGERAGFRPLQTYRHVDSRWLQEATIMAVPFLEQLLIYRSSQEGGLHYLRDSPFYLPHLKYLVLPGQEKNPDECCHIQEMQDVLVKAQNLEVLAASDCDCGSSTAIPHRERFRTEPWKTALLNLRQLSLHGLDPDNLAKILCRSPVLEDLEYFCDMDKYTVLQHDHLTPIRDTLRRFCYTSTTWEHAQGSSEDVIELISSFLRWDRTLRGDMNFSDFPKLEILEVEQLLLYGPVFDQGERQFRFATLQDVGPELFMSSLPPSLRILHIGMVLAWPELYRDLMGLMDKLYRFPDLVTVAVDPYEVPPTNQVEELTVKFAEKGITFCVGQTTQIPFSRGMLGVRPGHSDPFGVTGKTGLFYL
ncbi:hypothetical protein BGZ63DRAFT_86519 [Mariannaea sp. PMI_226]|nr:hypothetical protein BGZ63DRAFT_86519 [Mariannaea sp. PMI_226]